MSKVKKPVTKYVWHGRSYSVPAEVVAGELDKLEKVDGGVIPERFVRVAENPKHPCHGMFEWNDTEAGKEYRLIQAKQIIRAIKIRFIDPKGIPSYSPSRLSVNLSTENPEEPGPRVYVSTAKVLSDLDMKRQAISEARHQLQGFVSRYRKLKELAGPMGLIDEAIEVMENIEENLEE